MIMIHQNGRRRGIQKGTIKPAHPRRLISLFIVRAYIPWDALMLYTDSQRPRSDCASAQSDLGLRCPQMPDNTFSFGTIHVCYASLRDTNACVTKEKVITASILNWRFLSYL